MSNTTAPTFQLQDGTFCNPLRRLKRRRQALVEVLKTVKDGRKPRGIRHPLEVILATLLLGISSGKKNIAECVEFAQAKRKLLEKLVTLPYDIPCATTVSRAIQVCDAAILTGVLVKWNRIVFGELDIGEGASMDGKTLRGVHGKEVIKHIFSMVSHTNKRLLGQEGVKQKENEITACPRLLEQSQFDIYGMVITADALLTQTEIAKDIRSKGAHYIMMVKGNHGGLQQTIQSIMDDPMVKKGQYRYSDPYHGREVEVTVELTNDCDIEDLGKDWKDIAWVGKVTREGKRPNKRGELKSFHEETLFMSSVPKLTAKKASRYIREHWSIENGNHWQKDWSYLEDRQTLRKGHAPAVMSCLKSFWIGLLHEMGKSKISEILRRFSNYPIEHQQFLKQAHIYA